MTPDAKSVPLTLEQLLGGRVVLLCPGMSFAGNAQLRVGFKTGMQADSLLVDIAGNQVGYKSFIGRTVTTALPAVARIMAMVPSLTAVHEAAVSKKKNLRSKALDARTSRVTSKYGDLAEIKSQERALAKVFPNATIDLADRFNGRVTPFGQRKINEARRNFVVGLIHEARVFPDAAKAVSLISDSLGLVNGRAVRAVTMVRDGGVEVHMSQWGATSLVENNATAVMHRSFSNAIDEECSTEHTWHHIATHQFGHILDFLAFLSKHGFEQQLRPGKQMDFVKMRPAGDDGAEQLFAHLALIAAEQTDVDEVRQKFEQLVRAMIIDRTLELNEVEVVDGQLGSSVASQFFEDNRGSILEYVAELFAQVRVLGYGTEIQTAVGVNDQPRSVRQLMRYLFDEQIPGGDDAAGTGSLGTIEFDDKKRRRPERKKKAHPMEVDIDEKALGGRLRRRVTSMGRPSFDGDADGFITNPVTGRDDMPAPRKRPASPRSARDRFAQYNKPTGTQRFRSPGYASSWPDDEDDDMPKLPTRRYNRWGEGGMSSTDDPDLDDIDALSKPRSGPHDLTEDERKKVRLDGVSQNDIVDLFNDLMPIMKNMFDRMRAGDDDERDRKRIVKLHMYLQKLYKARLIRSVEGGVEIDMTERDVKRFQKGLESLIKNQKIWADNEAATRVFEQISKIYRGGFRSLPDADKKAAFGHIEVKELGPRLGRRARSAVRRMLRRPDFDGDGDGFITNPRTGRDDLPAPKKQSRRLKPVARPTSLSGEKPRDASPQKVSMAGPDDETAEGLEDLPISVKGARARFAKSKVKERPWAQFGPRVKAIEDALEQEHGNLETLEDFKLAFGKYHGNVIMKGWPDELNAADRGFLKGLLYTVQRFPAHFDGVKELKINALSPTDGVGITSGSTDWSGGAVRRSGATPFEIVDGHSVKFNFYRRPSIVEDPTLMQMRVKDGVSSQLSYAYIREVDDGKMPSVTDAEALDRMRELDEIGTGLHEGAHGLHWLRSVRDRYIPGKVTKDDVEAGINEIKKTQRAELVDNYMIQTGRNVLDDILELDSLASQPNGLLGVLDLYETAIAVARAESNANAEANLLAQLQQISDLVTRSYGLYEELRNATDDEKKELWEKVRNPAWRSKAEADKMIFEDPDMFRVLGLLATEIQMRVASGAASQLPLQGVLATVWAAAGDRLATANYVQGRLWDDLSKSEIAELRKAWKYVSSYAKDKNSWYGGAFFGNSVEGIAESVILRLLGGDLGAKATPEAKQALDKLLGWLLSFPSSPQAKAAFIKFDGATKNLYDLLALRRA